MSIIREFPSGSVYLTLKKFTFQVCDYYWVVSLFSAASAREPAVKLLTSPKLPAAAYLLLACCCLPAACCCLPAACCYRQPSPCALSAPAKSLITAAKDDLQHTGNCSILSASSAQGHSTLRP